MMKFGIGKGIRGGGKPNRLFLTILSYFLSLLIPIAIIGFATYMYSVRVMKTDFNERIGTNLKTAVQTVDRYLETAQETSFNFFQDDVVQMLLMPKDEQSLSVKAELWRLIKIIQRNENIVTAFTDRMFIYVDNKDLYVSGGINQFDSFFNNMYKYDRYDAAYWAAKLDSDPYIELLPVATVGLAGSAGKQVVPIVMSSRVQSHRAVMVLNISAEAIARTLTGNAVFGSTRFVVLDQSGNPIVDGSGYSGGVSLAGLLESAQEPGKSTSEVTLAGSRFELSKASSKLYGWTYYSLTPVSEFSRHTFSILQMTLLLALVLICMGIAFSFIFSFRIYNPIRSIRNILLGNNELLTKDDDSGASKDEFEQIRQSVSKLAHYQLEYKSQYDKHTSEYVEYSFLFLLKGHTINQEQILRKTLSAEFGFSRFGYVCCAVCFEFKDAFYVSIQDTERAYVLGGIKKIIWSLLGAEAPSYVLESRQNLYVGIVNLDGPEQAELLHKAFRRMLDIFAYDIHQYYDITIGIGSFCTGINDIGASYNDAMTAISKRDGEKRFQIVDSGQIEIENRFTYSFFDEQKILNQLKLGESSVLHGTVDEIVQANVSRSVSYEHLFQLFKELYMTGIRFLAEKGMGVDRLGPGQPFRALAGDDREQSFISVKEMQRLIHDFYGKIAEATRPEVGAKSGSLVTLIEKYVQDNYMRDVGLEQIAAEMGVSFKYVSRVFKEKTGMNLTDYINQVRTDKAKELLIRSDLRVGDIAEQVGIPSRTTFLRVFKKVEGISPNEFRTIHRQS